MAQKYLTWLTVTVQHCASKIITQPAAAASEKRWAFYPFKEGKLSDLLYTIDNVGRAGWVKLR